MDNNQANTIKNDSYKLKAGEKVFLFPAFAVSRQNNMSQKFILKVLIF